MPLATLKARGHGIVEFELARTPARASRIMRDWGQHGRESAVDSLFADLPFLFGYGLLLSALAWVPSTRIGEIAGSGAGSVCRWSAAVAACAALLDMVENMLLLRQLRRWNGSDAETWPAPAAWACATLNFAGAAAVVAWSVCFVVPALVTAG